MDEAGIEPETARSADQRLKYWAAGAPIEIEQNPKLSRKLMPSDIFC